MSIINDKACALSGHKKIEWVRRNMPILNRIRKDFEANKPLAGLKILVSVHVEAKTAYMAHVLRAGGAQVVVTGCNPLSTQDDVCAALVDAGIETYGLYGCDEEKYFDLLRAALDTAPNMIIDDGGDLVNIIHTEKQQLLENLIGGSEETTTGVLRLHARAKEGGLRLPMFAANDAYCKYLFDNRYGTGQSVWNGINRTTNLIVAGKTVVIAGYGWCGKGCAMRAKGLGANVIVTEIDPIKAIEAVMDGFRVMTMDQASELGDVFITVTGCSDVITERHFDKMKNGVLLANAGHFDCEVSVADLKKLAVEVEDTKPNIEGFKMADGRYLYLLAQGRLVNLAAGDGHAAEIMDMSFAVQSLAMQHIAQNKGKLENKVYKIPEYIDGFISSLKLETMGVSIDVLTAEQKAYIDSWQV